MKSTPSSLASLPPSKQVRIGGFSVILSNTTYSAPTAPSDAVTSSSAPEAFAECFPVTIIAFFPSANSALFFLITFSPVRSFTGIKKSKFIR